jgi:hypothetical protein
MPTIKCRYSLAQFELIFQQIAHKAAIEAVTSLAKGGKIEWSGEKISVLECPGYTIRFYDSHIGFRMGDNLAFDVEEKLYMNSNHSTKITFSVLIDGYVDEPSGKWVKKNALQAYADRIWEFVEVTMTENGLKPEPRFQLAEIVKKH